MSSKKLDIKQENIIKKARSLKEVLHISKAGLSMIKDGEFICVKDNSKTLSKIHPSKLKSIIINTTITVKSDVFFVASEYKIPVTFINKDLQSISLYQSKQTSKTLLSQVKVDEKKSLEISKHILIAKCKNQRNYIKRMDKYHKKYKQNITNMAKNIIKIKKAKNIKELLAYEGGVALWYFDVMVQRFGEYGFVKRHKKGAKDVINMSLNYLYAILYHKIHKLMIDNALSPYVGLFHANNDKNPSLVYDFIEEFRVYVVDMVVFSYFARSPLVNDKDMLSDKLKEKLSKAFAKRLLDKFVYKGKKTSIDEIMSRQTKELKRAILTNGKYRGFCPRLG